MSCSKYAKQGGTFPHLVSPLMMRRFSKPTISALIFHPPGYPAAVSSPLLYPSPEACLHLSSLPRFLKHLMMVPLGSEPRVTPNWTRCSLYLLYSNSCFPFIAHCLPATLHISPSAIHNATFLILVVKEVDARTQAHTNTHKHTFNFWLWKLFCV